MNRFFYILIFLGFAGCATETQYGKCIGITDDRDESLIYKISKKNLVLGIVFIETIFVPAVVVLDEFQCPVGIKK